MDHEVDVSPVSTRSLSSEIRLTSGRTRGICERSNNRRTCKCFMLNERILGYFRKWKSFHDHFGVTYLVRYRANKSIGTLSRDIRRIWIPRRARLLSTVVKREVNISFYQLPFVVFGSRVNVLESNLAAR